MPSFQLSLGHSRAKVLLGLVLIFTALVFTWSSDSAGHSLTTPIARPTPRVQGPYHSPQDKRQVPGQQTTSNGPISAGPLTSSAGPASPIPTIQTSTVAHTTTTTTAAARVSTNAAASSTLPLSMTTQTLTATATSTSSPPPAPDSNSGLIIGGAVVGGLVFAIGIALVAFKFAMSRKDRQRRNKEFAATMALDNRNDPILAPRKGYVELGEDPPTPGSGRLGAANLSRQGSQDAYFYKEQGQGYSSHGSDAGAGDYYNQHYVQERYGGAPGGHHGMYEETELSVIGGNSGRANVAYPPSTVPPGHYGGGYDYGHQGDYDYQGGQHHDGGYYGGGGQTSARNPQTY